MIIGCQASWPVKMALSPTKTLAPLFFKRSNSISADCSASELLLSRQWMLPDPAAQINKISLSSSPCLSFFNDPRPTLPLRDKHEGEEAKGASFYVIRDDLLHPLVNGNKARKLDALLPILQQHSATDVVTCGGCQSAHAAALAVSCAERGMRSHLLLRGEQPEITTGYNLVSLMFGNVSYVPRSIYAQRQDMLMKHANNLATSGGCVISVDDMLQSPSNGLTLDSGTCFLSQVKADEGAKRVVIVSEGAGDVVGLLGVIRLVSYLSQAHVFGKEQQINLVVDAGTGTTAIGLAVGALCLGLPWKVTAVMLADTIERYEEKEKCLISDFMKFHEFEHMGQTAGGVADGLVNWIERVHSRKFGKVLKGEIEQCRVISQQTGILLDPVYTLAAWEQSVLSLSQVEKGSIVVMLHTGGTLGLFGLAQRYSAHFRARDQARD